MNCIYTITTQTIRFFSRISPLICTYTFAMLSRVPWSLAQGGTFCVSIKKQAKWQPKKRQILDEAKAKVCARWLRMVIFTLRNGRWIGT